MLKENAENTKMLNSSKNIKSYVNDIPDDLINKEYYSNIDLKNLNPSIIRELDSKQISELCDEIRKFLIRSVSNTGGHLASNLGVVELTIAIHRAFDSPHDKIIWDVGHQSYVHKILTGRAGDFERLRQKGGISGFPKRDESIHDAFDAGHSSTSLSAAMGMALARDVKGESHHIVAIIGDGALTGGMVYEAINHIGSRNHPLIIILNDNDMSIADNVGSMHFHLSRLRSARRYIGVKRKIRKNTPGLARGLERIKNAIKYQLLPSALFEELGIKYLGPIDGHDVKDVETMLNRAKNFDVPVIIHVSTVKGKGYAEAENNPEKFHGISAQKSGKIDPTNVVRRSNSECFGNALCDMAETDPDIVAVTAAMPSGTGLKSFAAQFPDRFFDVGIAEEHAVTLCAGMAAAGLKPVFAVYSTFLQRAYDQVFHDVCLQNLPVLFAIDRAGPVGEDGPTHHGVYDIGFMSQMPNMTIYCPASQEELTEMLKQAFALRKPAAIRYPRTTLRSKNIGVPIEYGRWEMRDRIYDNVLIACGEMLPVAEEAALILHKKGFPTTVINARFLMPLDDIMLSQIQNASCIATIEAGVLNGGLGEHCLRHLSTKTTFAGEFRCFGVPDEPLPHASVKELYEMSGLTAENISNEVLATFSKDKEIINDKL